MTTMTRNTADLGRFHAAQGKVYPQVIREIRRGKKETHWMWYIFPQLRALAKSDMAYRFGIADRDEAIAYLDNSTLRVRLFECATGVLQQRRLMFGDTDTRKLHACMTLFREVADDPSLPDAVLGRFYEGRLHQLTIDVLAGRPIPQQMPTRQPVLTGWRRESTILGIRQDLSAAQRRERVDPWTRERMLSFVRGFGLSSVATRQLVDAWLADQGRARREGYERGFSEGRDEGYDEAQTEFENGNDWEG